MHKILGSAQYCSDRVIPSAKKGKVQREIHHYLLSTTENGKSYLELSGILFTIIMLRLLPKWTLHVKHYHFLNLDVKGRLAILARYRERLQPCCDSRFVVTVDRDRCLLIYPELTWVEIERKLDQPPSFNEQARMLQRLYIGHAREVDMDGQGRLLLPPALLQFCFFGQACRPGWSGQEIRAVGRGDLER